jgi:hypothetical protein
LIWHKHWTYDMIQYMESRSMLIHNKVFMNFLPTLVRYAFLMLLFTFSITQVASAMPPGIIQGRVFTDYNLDGIDNESGPGLAGVIVSVYDETGQITSTTTDALGNYSIPALTDGTKYRLEYVLPSNLATLSSSMFGTNATTTVKFITAPADDIDQGFSAPEDFCQADPFVLAPCFINGDPLGGGTANDNALVAIPYSATGQGQTSNTYIANSASIGTTYGTSFQKDTKIAFLSSVLKRHSGFGPGGTGAIYVKDLNNINSPVDLGWFSLDSLGFNTGTDPRILEPLPSDKTVPSFDSTAFSLIGKMSFGDMDISSDGKYLYVVNLFDKSLYQIFINNPYVKPTAADITVIPFTNPGCTPGTDWAPWGLKVYRGEVYAGLVCTAESSQLNTELEAHIVKLSGGAWAPVFDFPLDFERGIIIDNTPGIKSWFPWTDDPNLVFTNFKFIRPQPILSDIEFDADGSMVLGFTDRLGLQGGYLNYGPTASLGFPITTFAGGDMIRVCKSSGAFVLEGSGTGCQTTTGATQAEGPNGKEFYWTDAFADPSTNAAAFRTHNEVALGALTILPGSNEVVSTIFDPYAFNTNGLTYFSSIDGTRTHNYEIFPDAPGFFGKANGLGDIELLCNAAPIEIGNFIWKDTDQDGIQDPSESGIAGVNVSLVSATCMVLASTQTNANGEYYFNETLFPTLNLTPNTDYYIVVGNGQIVNSLLFDSLQLTVPNTGAIPSNDLNDSDGYIVGASCFVGSPYIGLTTNEGGANHSYDFGFFVDPCQIDWVTGAIAVANETCAGAGNGSISVEAVVPSGTVEYALDNGPFGVSAVFTSLPPNTYLVTARQVGSTTCLIDSAIIVQAGITVAPPSNVLAASICQYQVPVAGTGLSATQVACPAGYGNAEIRWYATATSTTVLATGDVFHPVSAGIINTQTPGVYTYYAESNCAPCFSTRVAAVFTVLAAPAPVITGDNLPCPNETVTYTTALNVGSTYQWQLVGAGTVVSMATNMFTVQFPDTTLNTPPVQVIVTETNLAGCIARDTLDIIMRPVALVCNPTLQVSLADKCCVKVFPGQLISGSFPMDGVTIVIKDAAGQALPADTICGAGTYTFTLTEPCYNNSCWGTLVAEDKQAPIINCQPLSFPCSYTDDNVVIPDLSSHPVFVAPAGAIGGVVINDNCGLSDIQYADKFTKYSCDTLFGVVTGVLVRTWFATDVSGNTSSCTQVISYIRQPVTNIVWPLDTTLSCVGGNTLPISTGYPSIAGLPINTNTHTYCDLDFTYSDNLQATCAGTKKIIRSWTVFNWCLPLNYTNQNIALNPLSYIQLITVKDSVAPVVNCPANMTVNTEETNCTAIVNLPDVIAVDACSFIKTGLAVTPVGNVTGVLSNFAGNNLWNPDTMVAFGSIQGLTLGEHHITYAITDDCGNVRTCAFQVNVIDAVPPVAVCDQITKVAVGSNGMTLVHASSFDDGSYDNCQPVHFKARRMNTSVCDTIGYQSFDDDVKFCCSDIGDTVLVVFRAYDVEPFPGPISESFYETHANNCMVRVIVQDKLKPALTCPQNITVNCNSYDPTLWAHGKATAVDNCGLDTITWSVSYAQFDSVCDQGTVRRMFTATDHYGNTSTCVQSIQVNRLLGFKVQWPNDLTITQCNALANTGRPIITDQLCGLPGISYTDEKITLVPDACYKIIRKWRVQDICEDVTNLLPYLVLNPTNSQIGPMSLADHYNHGYFEYNQVIKVIDQEAPMILNCPDTVVVYQDFSANDPTQYNGPQYWDPIHQSHDLCEGSAPLSITVSDLCSGADVKVSFTLLLDLNNDGVHETQILSSAVGSPILTTVIDTTRLIATVSNLYQIPYGSHKIQWTVNDGCGNIASCNYTFVVRDAKAPTISCLNGIAVNMMPTGEVQMWASDFLQYGQDNCTPAGLLEYGLSMSSAGNNGFPSASNLTFNCTQLGTQIVRLYARDKAGNYDYCETYILVQDNAGHCINTNKTDIAGSLKTELLKGVDQSNVMITGSNNALPNPSIFTNAAGTYAFNAIPLGANYTIKAARHGYWLNGVNMLDVLKIQRHILGIEPINTPYKQIAGDVNKSGSITSSDIIELRKIILGAIDSLPGNTSWRFVDKKHVFINPNNPFTSPIKEQILISDLQNQISDGDFVGLKVGDVTGDAVPNVQASSDDRTSAGTLVLGCGEQKFVDGEIVTVTVNATDLARILAYQFTLKFDHNKLTFNQITPNTTNGMQLENFSFARAKEGYISTAFHTHEGINTQADLFTISFTARSAGFLNQVLSLSNAVTPIAAFDAEGNFYDIALRFGNQAQPIFNAFEVFQNTPNPFDQDTKIGITIPEASTVKLTIFDVNGRTVYTTEKDLSKGLHHFEIQSGLVNVQGLLYYRVESAFGAIEKTMIHMNR